MKALILLLIAPIIFAYSVMCGGYVFENYWNWFIVTAFATHSFTYIQGLCMSTFFGYLVAIINMRDNINNSTKQQDKTDSVAVIGAFVASMLFPWIMMLFGAVVYHMFVL